MIIDNIADELGDVMLISEVFDTPGTYTFTSFLDSTVGETSSTFFTKEYRYSSNNVDFTSWSSVGSFNINNFQVLGDNKLYIQFRYTVSGTINAPITFNSLEFSGKVLFVFNKQLTLHTLKVTYTNVFNQ